MQLVFDGHNDVLLRLWTHERDGNDPVAEFLNGTTQGHIDAPRARKGGLAGGLCAIYIPSGDLVFADPDENGHYETPQQPGASCDLKVTASEPKLATPDG